MKKIIEYQAIYALERDFEEFPSYVNDWIKDGWQPLGGICVNTINDEEYFYQAMVKYESDVDGLIEILEE